jgi:phospholipase C
MSRGTCEFPVSLLNGVPGPYGLGVRVPLLVVSPWSRGGWVCSEVFDHTSLIRFVEARFGVEEPNITPYRRAVCGDLTAAFDFGSAHDQVPPLPNVDEFKPTGVVPPDFHPVPPEHGSVPTQEPGVRPPRRLGYGLEVSFDADLQQLRLRMRNRGSLGYTIGAGDDIDASLPNPGRFDLSLHGPNGFFRHFAGSGAPALRVDVDSDHGPGRVRIRLHPPSGRGSRHETVVQVTDAFGPDRTLRLRGDRELSFDTNHSGGWYDIALTTPGDSSFSYQLAGRLESAGRLTSDPQLGRS